MASEKVSVDEMADVINDYLKEYADLAADVMKNAVKKTATSVKKDIQANAPVETGAYKKSWTTKKTAESSERIEMTVYSKNRYQIAHLLEHGHALRGGGRARAFPHIAPAEEAGEEELVRQLKKGLEG
ncbi:MAG: HK97 gp10 family phage protein [Lachnospiraceae bacterium]|nr:HK97 gp10 family phage protein [Lachnospiraceae bacterium]